MSEGEGLAQARRRPPQLSALGRCGSPPEEATAIWTYRGLLFICMYMRYRLLCCCEIGDIGYHDGYTFTHVPRSVCLPSLQFA